MTRTASAAALDAAIARNPAARLVAPCIFLWGAFVSAICKGSLQPTASLRMGDAADFSTALSGLATFATR
jgi:hypothetical protein